MAEALITAIARALVAKGEPISHALLCQLAALPGSGWTLVDEVIWDAHGEAAEERRRADPALWAA